MLLTLFSAAVGALIGLGPALYLANRAERRERSRELWKRDVDLCLQLEELAGEIVDRFTRWGVTPEDYEELGRKTMEMARMSGKFPRHTKVQQAITDLHGAASRMYAARNRYKTQEARTEADAEMRERLVKLLAATSDALGREKISSQVSLTVQPAGDQSQD